MHKMLCIGRLFRIYESQYAVVGEYTLEYTTYEYINMLCLHWKNQTDLTHAEIVLFYLFFC